MAMVESDLAAYARLTPGPMAVFETWTRGKASIPTGPNIIDLGRCLVAPQFRGLDLMMLVCLEALLISSRIGYDVVVGSVIPGRRTAEMLKFIGFENSGSPVQSFKEKPTGPYLIQPLVAHCNQTDHWATVRQELLRKLGMLSYWVQSDISMKSSRVYGDGHDEGTQERPHAGVNRSTSHSTTVGIGPSSAKCGMTMDGQVRPGFYAPVTQPSSDTSKCKGMRIPTTPHMKPTSNNAKKLTCERRFGAPVSFAFSGMNRVVSVLFAI